MQYYGAVLFKHDNNWFDTARGVGGGLVEGGTPYML